MNTGKYLDCFWIVRVEHIRMTHGCHVGAAVGARVSRKGKNAELDAGGTIIHRSNKLTVIDGTVNWN